MRFFICIAFILGFYPCIAQQGSAPFTVCITDSLTNEPLPYANILIGSKSLGIASDLKGNFKLPAEGLTEKDSILISYLGYKTCTISLGKFLQGTSKVIRLAPATRRLKEVVVLPKELNLGRFMTAVNEKYNEQVRREPHIAISHYREKYKLRSMYAMYTESIGYSVYMGTQNTDSPLSNYKFFSENTRKSHYSVDWLRTVKKPSGKNNLPSGGGITLNAFRRFELNGPLNPLNKKYRYRLDSSYFENNQLIYCIQFVKKGQEGMISVRVDTYEIKSIELVESQIWSPLFDKTVKGKLSLRFQYFVNQPFVNEVKVYYKKGEIEYWNEFTVLAQKLDAFAISQEDLWSLNTYNLFPFVQYHPESWAKYNIPVDPDFLKISSQLAKNGIGLEKQFTANSEKWLEENETDTQTLERARILINELKMLF